MKISEININNFRGLNLTIENLKKSFLIIGKNDSGKSNFCYAIRKVLDYDVRRQPMLESDSTESNMENISIKITFDLDGISTNNRAILKQYIDSHDEGTETLTVQLNAKFNKDTQVYDENIVFGTTDLSKEKSVTNGNELDKVLDLIYVYPSYDLSRDTKNYFKYHNQTNKENEIFVGHEIIDEVKNLNEKISNDNVIQVMRNEINDFDSMKEMFEDVTFEIQSDFDLSNIYKNLKINPMVSDEKIITIGDGKNKMLAFLLQRLGKKNEKEKIIILEEPENHLFPLLQKHYSSIVDKFGFGQTIITTHSPSIIDFRKTEEIFKFNYKIIDKKRNFELCRVNINGQEIYKNFGYSLNEEIAESFFYDEVLLIEGYSEKIFYNILINTDSEFRKKIINRKFGFVCVYGTDFFPSREILKSLGIKVHILTDNDFFSINKSKKRYAGLQRSLKMLSHEEKEKFCKKFNATINNDTFNVEINSSEQNFIEEHMSEILDFFSSVGIYIHHDQNGGFELAFVNFIGISENDKEQTINYLKDKKMKNLHSYLIDKQINLHVNDSNKNNILVKFIYEN